MGTQKKRYTEEDRHQFLIDGLNILKSELENAMTSVMMQHSNFIFKKEDLEEGVVFSILIDNTLRKRIKLWISFNMMAHDGAIYISDITHSYRARNDNSFSKWIKCRISLENELEIDYMSFSMSRTQEIKHWEEVAIDIWKTEIIPYIR